MAQPLVTSQISATPSIFNPNEPVSPLPSYQPIETSISTNSPLLQRSTPEYLSQANSLQESFRSSPVAVGVPYSSTGTSRSVTPQNQNSSSETVPVTEKPSIPLSSARAIPLQVPEPITPQNTPANVSYFGFDAYTGRDFPSRTIDLEKEPVLAKSHTDSPLPILRDSSTARSVAEAKTSVTFAPVSAVQVSEKLEHLLAERKENSPDQPAEAKIGENVALCRTSEGFDDIKLTNTEEKNNSPRSDVFGLKQETSEAVQPTISPQEVHTDREKLNLPQSHGVSSNVQPSQQYYQPFTSSVNFFTEKLPEQTLNFNLAPATVASLSSTFPNSSTTFAQSASSYFPGPESTGSSYNLQYKENSTNYPVDVARSRNDSQQVSFDSSTGSNFPSPSISVAQSSWAGNQTSQTVIATCNAPDQSLQQPLFYNIAQFQDDPPKHAPASHLYAPLVKNTPTNHAQHYFDNISESKQPYNNITSGIGLEFSATSSTTTIVPEPTGSATLNPVQMSVNPLGGRTTTDSVPPSFQNLVRAIL